MEEQKQIQVGDVVYAVGNYGINKTHKIDRVTPKRAYCGSLCLDRVVGDGGRIRDYGAHEWSSTMYYIENDELRIQLEEQQIRTKISYFNKWSKLTIEDAKAVCAIIDKYTNP